MYFIIQSPATQFVLSKLLVKNCSWQTNKQSRNTCTKCFRFARNKKHPPVFFVVKWVSKHRSSCFKDLQLKNFSESSMLLIPDFGTTESNTKQTFLCSIVK